MEKTSKKTEKDLEAVYGIMRRMNIRKEIVCDLPNWKRHRPSTS